MTASVDVLRQLNDLPTTFKRPNTPYLQLVDSFNGGLSNFTGALDAVLAQTFEDAQYGWLDVWGAIFSIQRQNGEADGRYRARITYTLLAWVGTVPSIERWAVETLGASIAVTENLPGVGYEITFPGGLTSAQITAFLVSLARIRPAGVPFTYIQQQIGLYLDTIDYMGLSAVVGEYLTDDGVPAAPPIPALTNSTKPLLPEYYFTDPTLNPGITP